MRDSAITAVIPAFNAASTLAAALQSIIGEPLKPYDVIVVDDGSEDGTADLANSFGVRCIRQENAGPGVARNVGIEAASTPLIAFLDADDTVAAGGILRRVTVLGSSDLLITGADTIFGEGGHRLSFAEIANAPALIKSPSGWLARREALASVGGFSSELRCLEDVELAMRMAAAGCDVRISSAATFEYSGVTPGRRILLAEALLYIAKEMMSGTSPFASVASERSRKQLATKYLKHSANVFAAASDRDGLRKARAARVELGLRLSPELILASTPRLYSAMIHLLRKGTRPQRQAIEVTHSPGSDAGRDAD